MAGELVVYRLAEEDRSVTALALSTRFPARATGWTPSGDECLDAGLYAWTVRGEQGEQWADPLLFRIAEAPSADEVRRALEVLRSYLDSQGLEEGVAESGEQRGGAAEEVAALPRRVLAAGFAEHAQPVVSPEQAEAAVTGPPSGVRAEIAGATADTAAVRGVASSPTGFVYGVWGETSSPAGRGVAGWSYATSGDAFGVHGRNTSPDGAAVFGWTTAGTGPAFGVEGITSSSAGAAVIGTAIAGSGSTTGVRGVSRSAQGVGGLFSNTGGGLLLAANDQPSLTDPEFEVTAAGDVFLAGELSCTQCVGSGELATGAGTNRVLGDQSVTHTKIAPISVGFNELAHRTAVFVECNGSCLDITAAEVCGGPRSVISITCSNVEDLGGSACPGTNDNECVFLDFSELSDFDLGLFCDDVDGYHVIVYCLEDPF